MKKKIITVALVLSSVCAMAQQKENRDTDFEFGTQPKTVISREYSAEWKKGDEPYYPVNDEKNGALYAEYKKLADAEPDVIFGGRLGEYKYYDMDKVIEVALDVAAKELA